MTLDLATRLGFAVATAEAVQAWPAGLEIEGAIGPLDGVTFGAQRIASPSIGHFFDNYARWLSDMLTQHQPDALVFEAPIGRNQFGQNHSRRIFGMIAFTERSCALRGIEPYEVAVSTVRKHFLGSGAPKDPQTGKRLKGRALKQAVIDRCRARGWAVESDDAADSLALLDYACACLRPERRAA